MQGLWQSAFVQYIWKYAGAVSIRVKVLGIVLGVIVLLGTFVILQIRTLLENTLSYQMEEQGIALANNIAQEAALKITAQDMDGLALLLAERRVHYSSESHNTPVDYVFVQDETGKIIAGEGRLDRDNSRVLSDQSHGQHLVFLVHNGETIEIRVPIPQTDLLLRLGLSRSGLTRTVTQVTFQLFATTLIMVAIGFAAAIFLTWILTRPLYDLVDATHYVARGDFSRRLPRWANDEIGELATAFNAMTASLAQAEQERIDREHLREQYISGVIVAQENERQRIARELHDSASQSLTSLLVGLQNLKQSANADEIQCRVDELRSVIAATLDEIHVISWRLRPRTLDDLGLVIAVKHYVQDYQKRYSIPVEVVISGIEQRLAPELETTIYRIVQEGLTNIARYAQATNVSLIITCKDNKIRIIIEDNGIGFDPVAVQKRGDRLGLPGIRERAGLFGGTLTIESQPGQGASLFIEMPYKLRGKEENHDT